MQLSQIRNFVHVVEQKSFSRAASVVRIAQPALSRQIKLLEDELGAPLLVRQARGVMPTEAGQAFLKHARLIAKELDAGREAVRATQADPSGRLLFGAPTPFATIVHPQIAGEFLAHYPRVLLRLASGASASIYQMTVRGELDVAVLYEERNASQLHHAPLLSEDLVLVGPAGALSPHKAVEPAALANMRFVLPSSPNPLRQIIDDFQGRYGLQLRAVLEVDILGVMLQALTSANAYVLLPLSSVREEAARGEVSWARIKGAVIERRLMLARPLDRPKSAAAAVLERLVRQFVLANAGALGWRPLFSSLDED